MRMRMKSGYLLNKKETVGFLDVERSAYTNIVSLGQIDAVDGMDSVAHLTAYLPNKKESVGFQDVERPAYGNIVSLGQIDGVDGMDSVAHLIGVASYDPVLAERCLIDCFYEKLIKLHESSGLSFVFNFREAKLDLYVLYKAVTERDGFLEVSQNGKWEEVASFLYLNNHLSLLPCQLRKVYENVLFRYEQMYFYRMPVKASKKEGYCLENEDGLDCLALKKKYYDNISEDCAEKTQPAHDSCRESTSVQHVAPKELGSEPISGFDSPVQKSDVRISPLNKKTIDDPRPLLKPRTAYQIFLTGECNRLKKVHGESPGTLNFREMAGEKWKNMSETDRQPYFEEFQKQKEIYKQEVGNDEQPRQYKRKKYQKRSMQSVSVPNDDDHQVTMKAGDGNSFALDERGKCEREVANDEQCKQYKKRERQSRSKQSISTPKDDAYHVTLEAHVENSFVPDESLIESTIQVMKHARPTDLIFQTDWNGFSEMPDDFC